jgi:hypothetical protein
MSVNIPCFLLGFTLKQLPYDIGKFRLLCPANNAFIKYLLAIAIEQEAQIK